MTDNVDITPGTGATVGADLISTVLYQRVKLIQGADGTNDGDVCATAPLEVTLAHTGANLTAVKVDASGAAVPITDNAGSLTVDGSVTANAGTNLNTSLLALESGGNLATLAGAVSSSKVATKSASGDFADGAIATLGAKADAKSTATDTTAITMMQVMKQISASVQAPPSQAVTNVGTFAVQADLSGTSANATAIKVNVASGGIASGAVASGAIASGAIASGAVASGAFASGALASGSISAGAIATGATSIAANEDQASADADTGVKMLVTRRDTPANTSGTTGDYEFLQTSGGYLWVHDNKGLANKAFSATFTTNTRPANTTAYSAGDSISNNGTAGSVTALSASVSDVNDDPVFLSEILLTSTDTGLSGKRVRAYVFNSDPTANSGVGGGDNAAFSQKIAGYIGSFSGVMETGFSDGTVGRLVPSYNDSTASPSQAAPAGGFIVAHPVSGNVTMYIQYQAIDAFTPSANSTTLIGKAKGWQGRAA